MAEDENAVPILFELVKKIGEIVYGAAKVGLITFEHSAGGSFVNCELQGSAGDGSGMLPCVESVDLANVLLAWGRGNIGVLEMERHASRVIQCYLAPAVPIDRAKP